MTFKVSCTKASLLVLLILSSISVAHAQDDIKDSFPTNKLRSKTIDNKKKNRPKEYRIAYIYKTTTLKTLYGNPCALDVTRRWGFEYAIEDNYNNSFKKSFKRARRNFGVKAKLFFTKGPWWRIVINKRLKECQRKTGDAIG